MDAPVLKELVEMSRYLGDPGRTYAILGEGNTSARIDEDTFYVKASGYTLADATAEAFVKVSISKVVQVLDDEAAGDDDVTETFKRSLIDPGEARRPSTEAMLHAVLLSYPEVRFIGHTHPVYTLMLLCSKHAEEAVAGRLCPDHIVSMGHRSLFVPYIDPGLILAREVKRRVAQYVRDEAILPKAIVMQNHGLFALGDSAKAVTSITDMTEKMSQVIIGTYAVGRPNFLSHDNVDRIFTRPDEKYRQNIIEK